MFLTPAGAGGSRGGHGRKASGSAGRGTPSPPGIDILLTLGEQAARRQVEVTEGGACNVYVFPDEAFAAAVSQVNRL